MISVLIGLLVGLISSFIPGLSPFQSSLICQSLHLFGFSGEAVVASTVAYIFASITDSAPTAVAPDLVGSLEASTVSEPLRAFPLNVEKLQGQIAWGKILILAIAPPIIIFLNTHLGSTTGIHKGTNIGFFFLAAIALLNGVEGLLYAATYGLMFYLLKDNLYAPFIIGMGYKILPSLIEVSSSVIRPEPTEETPIAPLGVISIQGIFITYLYTAFTQGISPSGLSTLDPSPAGAGVANRVLQHFLMEVVILSFMLIGEFSGKASVGQIARPEHLSYQLVMLTLVAAILWQLYLSKATTMYWVGITRSKQSYKLAKLAAIIICTISLSYIGSWQGWLVLGITLTIPHVLPSMGLKRDNSIDSVVYTIPMV